jgi:DNA-binding response OmpR family regulator
MSLPFALTALIAEKRPLCRAALVALLVNDGYGCYQAANLSSALGYINQFTKLSVLLIDLEMPGWFSMTREAVRLHDPLIIAMEGGEVVSETEDFKQSGIHVCLKKPIVYNHVRMAIRQNIAGQKPNTEEGKLSLVNTALLIGLTNHWPSRN